jgi:DNA-binding CsgD family transcriptional regulator
MKSLLAHYRPILCNHLDRFAIDEINAVLKTLSKANSLPDIRSAIDRFGECQGSDTVGQLLLPGHSVEKAVHYSHSANLDDYTEAYLKSNTIALDPITAHIRRQCFPIAFGLEEQRKAATRNEQIVYALLDAHQIRYGIVVPVHTPSSFSLFKVAFSQTDPGFTARLPALATASQLIAAQLHQALCRLHGIAEPGHGIVLSSREKECLTWSAAGKTAAEIAKTLTISEATVTFHIENAKRKLDAKTLPQAVARAMHFNLIIP